MALMQHKYLADGDAPDEEEDIEDDDGGGPADPGTDPYNNQQVGQQAGQFQFSNGPGAPMEYVPPVGADDQQEPSPPMSGVDPQLIDAPPSPPIPQVAAPPAPKLNVLQRMAKLATQHPGATTPPPPSDGTIPAYPDALKGLAKIYDQYPQRKAPNWIERVAAGALGAAAGYSNAARRAAPIDIQKSTEGILYPGYDAQLAAWQSRVIPAQQAVTMASEQVAAQRAGALNSANVGLKQAQTQMNLDRGGYYSGLNNSKTATVTPDMAAASNGVYTVGQQIPMSAVTALAGIAAGRYDKPEKTMPVSDPDIAKRIGVKVGATVPISLYQAGVNANSRQEMSEFDLRQRAATGDKSAAAAVKGMDDERARTARESRDPLTDLMHQTLMDQKKQADLDAIGNWKLNEEKSIQQHRDAALNTLSQQGRVFDGGATVESETKRINAETQNQLQNVQNQFAQKARARGLQPDDYDVSIGGPGSGYITYAKRAPVIAPVVAPIVQAPVAPPAQQRLPIAPAGGAPPVAPPAAAAHPAAAPRPAIGQAVTVDGKPAVVTGINPATGKPIVRFQ